MTLAECVIGSTMQDVGCGMEAPGETSNEAVSQHSTSTSMSIVVCSVDYT